jgi:hypothetical protein
MSYPAAMVDTDNDGVFDTDCALIEYGDEYPHPID